MSKLNIDHDMNKRNSLGMSKMVYAQLIKKLNSIHNSSPESSAKRIYTRMDYFDPYFELILEKTKHSQRRKITVASRNISRGGISVLHSSFIYPGTRITAKLRKTDGNPFQTSGIVCRCEHRGGVVHEIGIEFDTKITVQEFVQPDIIKAVKAHEIVDPTTLEGKILFVGNDPAMTPFFREYLIETNINYGFVDSAEEALHKDLDEYQLLFVSLDAGDMSGPELIRCLRDCGNKKPIILAGQADSDQIKQQVRLSAADMFLPIPITQRTLLCALGEYLLADWSDETLEAIRTGVDLDTVTRLHDELADLAAVLDTQLLSEDSVEIYITCTKVRNISLLLGMKSLHNLTFTVCEEIAQTGDLKKYESELSSIKHICKNALNAA